MTSSTTMATASASSSPTKPPDPSSTHRLSAAADLIRNLDAALSSMNHAASAAARDAAKARRNAKAAGEVARRYGGSGGPSSSLRVNTGVHGGGSFGKRKSPRGTPKAASAMTKDERLKEAEQRALERKWERRTAARLAAEARQRRESPRKEGGAKGGGNGLAGFRAAVEETVERSHGHYGHGSPGKASGADASGAAADAAFEGNHSNPPPQVSNESSDDRTADGTTDFEDALDHIHSEESNSSEHRRYEDPQQHYDQSQKNWKQHTEDQVTQHDYYNQQQQYYGQQQGQQQYYNQNESQEEYYNRMQQDQSQYEQAWQSSAQQQQNQPQWQQQPQTQLPASATTTATGRIAASNAEDVLALSLELERTRSQLAQTTTTLESTQAEMASLQTSHSHLQSENDRLTKELSTTKESTSSKIQDLTQKYQQEAVRAKAAEEDAALALDLAKEAQAAKEEVETWLGRSLEEIDVWKKRAKELEGLLQQHGSFSGGESGQGYYEGASEEGFTSPDQKKFVRFADQNDTPVSPLGHAKNDEAKSQFQNSLPPPAPATPTSRSSNAPSPSSTSVNTSTQTIEGTSNNENSTPSKSAIATGRAWLHRNSPLLSPPGSSTSSLLSPDPKLKAAELLKRSAETTKLLREKLRHGNSISKPTAPPSLALIAATAANAKHSGGNSGEGSALSMWNDNSFATRQGAACRAVGKFIRESGKRLELEGKWWDHPRKVLTDGGAETETNEPILFHGVAELESMVKDYCGTVEGTIGKQKEKIEELVAFCDLLEKEVVNVRVNQEGGGDGIGSATAVAGTF